MVTVAVFVVVAGVVWVAADDGHWWWDGWAGLTSSSRGVAAAATVSVALLVWGLVGVVPAVVVAVVGCRSLRAAPSVDAAADGG